MPSLQPWRCCGPRFVFLLLVAFQEREALRLLWPSGLNIRRRKRRRRKKKEEGGGEEGGEGEGDEEEWEEGEEKEVISQFLWLHFKRRRKRVSPQYEEDSSPSQGHPRKEECGLGGVDVAGKQFLLCLVENSDVSFTCTPSPALFRLAA